MGKEDKYNKLENQNYDDSALDSEEITVDITTTTNTTNTTKSTTNYASLQESRGYMIAEDGDIIIIGDGKGNFNTGFSLFLLFFFFSSFSLPQQNPHPFSPQGHIKCLGAHVSSRQHQQTIEYIQERYKFYMDDLFRFFISLFVVFFSLTQCPVYIYLAFLVSPYSSTNDYDTDIDSFSDGNGGKSGMIASLVMVFLFFVCLGLFGYYLRELVRFIRQPGQVELGCCSLERRRERMREDVEQWCNEEFGVR